MPFDPYVILGLSRDASGDELQQAWEGQVALHRDRGNALAAQLVEEAYAEIMGDTAQQPQSTDEVTASGLMDGPQNDGTQATRLLSTLDSKFIAAWIDVLASRVQFRYVHCVGCDRKLDPSADPCPQCGRVEAGAEAGVEAVRKAMSLIAEYEACFYHRSEPDEQSVIVNQPNLFNNTFGGPLAIECTPEFLKKSLIGKLFTSISRGREGYLYCSACGQPYSPTRLEEGDSIRCHCGQVLDDSASWNISASVVDWLCRLQLLESDGSGESRARLDAATFWHSAKGKTRRELLEWLGRPITMWAGPTWAGYGVVTWRYLGVVRRGDGIFTKPLDAILTIENPSPSNDEGVVTELCVAYDVIHRRWEPGDDPSHDRADFAHHRPYLSPRRLSSVLMSEPTHAVVALLGEPEFLRLNPQQCAEVWDYRHAARTFAGELLSARIRIRRDQVVDIEFREDRWFPADDAMLGTAKVI